MARLTVLFLCTGNTCRSPLAEALARHRYGEEGACFLSAGLQASAGLPASPGSVEAVSERGASLGDHQSRPLTPELVATLDWVIAMTRPHADLFRRRFPEFTGKVALLGAPGVDIGICSPTAVVEEVDDPFGGDLERYAIMAAQVERLLENWADVFSVRR